MHVVLPRGQGCESDMTPDSPGLVVEPFARPVQNTTALPPERPATLSLFGCKSVLLGNIPPEEL